MKLFGLLGVLAVAIGFVACGDDGSSASAEDDSSSSWTQSSPLSSSSANSSSSTATPLTSTSLSTSSSSRNDVKSSSSRARSSSSFRMDSIGSSSLQNDNPLSSVTPDTTKITYKLKRFDGPLANPHKGFTVPTGGAWIFVPEFEYGPYGSLNNKAWDLVTYGSGHQKWSKLNPAKDVYDWTELDKLLDALAEHNMGYALRVLPYSPSYIKSDDTPEEEYDWTPPFVYESGAKKITATFANSEGCTDIPPIENHLAEPFSDLPVKISRRLWRKSTTATRVSNTSTYVPLANGASGTLPTWTAAKCPPIR